ncbi:MAG: hypothetical protein JNM21_15930 [Taibaiella sp.]|nr:hypothetical protein [Taibaiella sp.]
MKRKQLMKMTCLCWGAGFLLPLAASAQQVKDNAVLQQMADEDQQQRLKATVDWAGLNREDSIRRLKVFELIRHQEVITAKDHLNAGIILQHGKDTVASGWAVQCFATAISMDTTIERWRYAAAVDRDLLLRDKPQIYGTQFLKDAGTGKWTRYRIDSTQVSDEQRRYYSVETLAEQVEKERLMNLQSFSDVYKTTHSLDNTINQIKLAFEKGRLSAYSLEAEINQFGYELLGQGKLNEALAIFKLNTELYPDSFNTFNSYGEYLIAAGKKKAGLKAYKKSLKLKPANEKARRALEARKQKK